MIEQLDADIQISPDSPIVAQMRLLRSRIDDAKQARSTKPIVDHFYRALGNSTPLPLPSNIACKKGCAYCCNTWVYATAPEIFTLASWISVGENAAMSPAIKAAAQVRQKLPIDKRAVHMSPCPVLHGYECTAHEARPAACRTAYSIDSDACRASVLDPMRALIPMPDFSVPLRAAYAIALEGALIHAGYSAVRYELRTALDIALSVPDAEPAWLRGEDIFASALQEAQEPFIASPIKQALYRAAFDPLPIA